MSSFETISSMIEDDLLGPRDVLDLAYLAGRDDARKEIAESKGGTDTAYLLRYPDGSYHDKVYATKGRAKQARSLLIQDRGAFSEAKHLRIQELRGSWVDIGE